jgi:hypothetical protein
MTTMPIFKYLFPPPEKWHEMESLTPKQQWRSRVELGAVATAYVVVTGISIEGMSALYTYTHAADICSITMSEQGEGTIRLQVDVDKRQAGAGPVLHAPHDEPVTPTHDGEWFVFDASALPDSGAQTVYWQDRWTFGPLQESWEIPCTPAIKFD